jgi:signal transduction histidine kinase
MALSILLSALQRQVLCARISCAFRNRFIYGKSVLSHPVSRIMFKRFSIKSKIVLPYTLLFAVVITATSLITIGIVYRRMDERIERQMKHMAEAISNMGFLLSDDFLSSIRIREVVGADIIAYKYNGEVTATTLRRDRVGEAMTIIRAPEIEERLSQPGNRSLIRNIRYLDRPCKVIYRRLIAPEREKHTVLSLIVSTEDIALAKRRSAMTISMVAVSGILLVAVVGSIIAGSITAPVKHLVKATEQIAAGDLTAEAAVRTRDEIGSLANSFNQMTGELKRSRDKLVQSEKLAAVGQLAAGIAHEIRNPLTGIKMIVQLLRGRFQEDESGRESIQAVLDEINRLEIVISGLLDFARPTELSLKPVDVTDVINDVLKLMEADLRHRKIELVKCMDETLPEVMLDTNRMKQVFMNVILNSMQAIPEDGKITIKCHYEEETHTVQVVISDTGTGMSQEILAQAFEPFFSTKSGGTGLGLANVKKIMEQHGGGIKVESEEGQGTKVVISIEHRA